jgi:hypothetical protein
MTLPRAVMKAEKDHITDIMREDTDTDLRLRILSDMGL